MTGTKIVGNEHIKVIDQGVFPVKKHFCSLPGRRQRKKLSLGLLATVECRTCEQQWKWVCHTQNDGYGYSLKWEWEKI